MHAPAIEDNRTMIGDLNSGFLKFTVNNIKRSSICKLKYIEMIDVLWILPLTANKDQQLSLSAENITAFQK